MLVVPIGTKFASPGACLHLNKIIMKFWKTEEAKTVIFLIPMIFCFHFDVYVKLIFFVRFEFFALIIGMTVRRSFLRNDKCEFNTIVKDLYILIGLKR